MKLIPFEKVYRLLENCSACVVDDIEVLYPCLHDDENDDVFLHFDLGSEDLGYKLEFNKSDNEQAQIVGASIFLVSFAGDTEQITLLKRWEAEHD